MILLETPPGQHPTRMIPIAMYGSSPNILVRMNATAGMSVYCAQAPMKISNGLRANTLISSTHSVRPIVSIIMPRMTLAQSPFTHENRVGKRNASMAASITNIEECEDRVLLIDVSIVLFPVFVSLSFG